MRLAIVLLAAVLAAGVAAKTPPTASDELGAALKTLRAKHVNRAHADWTAIEAQARTNFPYNSKPEAAYPAIEAVIKALGEKHSFLIKRDEWMAAMADNKQSAMPAVTPPDFRLLPDRIGYVHVYGFVGNPKAITDYENRFRAAMADLRRRGACRYMVDLRGNDGGNMWPMLNGLAPLLGDPPFGFFEPGADPGEVWTVKQGEVQGVDGDIARMPASVQKHLVPPVAVLVDRKTASSGEFTAMAFEGRGQARLFGQKTAGYVTVNDMFPLPDGAMLAVTESGSQDRLHREYRDHIAPDQVTAPGPATDAAARSWLEAQTCPSG